MNQKLPCVVVLAFKNKDGVPLIDHKGLVHIKNETDKNAGGVALIVRANVDSTLALKLSNPFKSTHNPITDLARNRELAEQVSTNIFVGNINFTDVKKQPGGNGGGGDTTGNRQHRGAFVDSSSKCCAWHLDGGAVSDDYFSLEIDFALEVLKNNTQQNESARAQSVLSPDYTKSVPSVTGTLVSGYAPQYARYFSTNTTLSNFQASQSCDFQTLSTIPGAKEEVLKIGENILARGSGGTRVEFLVCALKFESVAAAFDWLVDKDTKKKVLDAPYTPRVEMIAMSE